MELIDELGFEVIDRDSQVVGHDDHSTSRVSTKEHRDKVPHFIVDPKSVGGWSSSARTGRVPI